MYLRPYQTRALDAVISAWQRGAGRVCLVLPTGAGKTFTAHAISQAVGGRALWLVHRTELAAQAPGPAVTIQSLLGGHRPECDLLIADECHHLAPGAARWNEIARHYPRVLGLTATPERQDGSPLGDLFDELVSGVSYSELIAGGWLVPARVFRPAQELESGVAQDPSASWKKYSSGRRGFAFFGRVAAAKQYSEAVDGSAVVWGSMPADERASALARFRAGELQCLANVQILTEGVDVPEASVCLLASGCDHPSGYLQRVGRVLRTAPGKTDAILVDLVGASHRHGLPHEDRRYSLTGQAIRTVRDSISLTVCKACGATYKSAPVCPECGYAEPPKTVRQRVWGVPLEEVTADSLTPKQAAILQYRKRMAASGPEELRELYQGLRATADQRGYKPGWAAYQFKMRVGRWPGAREIRR